MSKPIPYHQGKPILGALAEFRADQPGFFVALREAYGDIVRLSMLNQRWVVLNHPDLVQALLVANADKVRKSRLDHAVLRRFIGRGLLISEGDFHRGQRKLMQPAFHHKRIEAYGQVTTDFTEWLAQSWHDGQTLDIHDEMTRLTLYIVGKVLYDADLRDQADDIGQHVHVINHEGEEQYRAGFVLPAWLPTRQNRAISTSLAYVNALILPIIEARRASGEDRGDLLSMLLAAQDEATGVGMTDQQVRDEVMTMFIAGHETTSNALAWTWYLLATHPAALAALHVELDQVLGGRAPRVSDLPQLKFTEWVIKEAMRLYPPAWLLSGREAQTDLMLDGYAIRRGEILFASPWAMHRDPRYYDDAAAFRPERWANDFEKSLPRYAYFPFGGGPRVCIGNSFAMMEARLVLATLAQRFTVDIDTTQPVLPEPLITLRPKGGLRATVRARARVAQPDGVLRL